MIISWNEFKKIIEKDYPENGTYVYRGQENSNFSLKTTLHRFYNESEYKKINKLYFDFIKYYLKEKSINEDSFLATCAYTQHHGFPTPLLDWTFQPYTAAYFAFRNISSNITEQESVSIYIFKYKEWDKDYKCPEILLTDEDFFKIINIPIYALPIRAHKQYSVFSFSNVANIENFIKINEKNNNKQYLYKFDIDIKDRKNAIKDLDSMGINEMKFFEGRDAFWKTQKERFFCADPISRKELLRKAYEQARETLNKHE